MDAKTLKSKLYAAIDEFVDLKFPNGVDENEVLAAIDAAMEKLLEIKG